MAEESGQSSLTVNITRAEFREDIQTLRDEFRQHYATKEDLSKLETGMGELRGEINGLHSKDSYPRTASPVLDSVRLTAAITQHGGFPN